MSESYLLYHPSDRGNCANGDYLHGFVYQPDTKEVKEVRICVCGEGHKGTVRLNDFDSSHIVQATPEQLWSIEYAIINTRKAKQWLLKRVTDCFPDRD